MKTLISPKATISEDGKTLTLTCAIQDLPYSNHLTRRVSHAHLNLENEKHQRRVISTSDAVMVESRYAKMAIPNNVLAIIGAATEPKTTFPPVFKKGSVPCNVSVSSELPFTLQWETAEFIVPPMRRPDETPKPVIWTPIQGATQPKLDESSIPVGHYIRCVATNAAGKTISQPAKKT